MAKAKTKKKLSCYASLFYNAMVTGLAFSFTLLPPRAAADGQRRDRDALRRDWSAISGDMWRAFDRESGR